MRLVYGIALILIGAALVYWWALGTGSIFRWGVCAVCIISGAFAVFEARVGWCVVRAMGIKTPM